MKRDGEPSQSKHGCEGTRSRKLLHNYFLLPLSLVVSRAQVRGNAAVSVWNPKQAILQL